MRDLEGPRLRLIAVKMDKNTPIAKRQMNTMWSYFSEDYHRRWTMGKGLKRTTATLTDN